MDTEAKDKVATDLRPSLETFGDSNILDQLTTAELLNAIPEPVSVVNADGRLVYLNAAWQALTSFVGEQHGLGTTLLTDRIKAFRPDESPVGEDDLAIRRALTGEIVEGSEILLRYPDDRVVWLRTNARPVITSSGELVGAIASTQDVSQLRFLEKEHRRASRLLQERVQQLELIISSMNEGVLITDTQGVTLLTNRVLDDLLGPELSEMPPAERVRHLNIRDWDGNPLSASESPIFRVMQGHRFHDEQALITGADGRPIYLGVSGGPLQDADGEILGGVFLVRDLTAARQAEQERESFVSLVAHEIRTPATLIRGHTQLLMGSLSSLDEATLRQRLSTIDRHTELLSGLVSQLLDVRKIEAGEFAVAAGTVDYGALVGSVCREPGSRGDDRTIRCDSNAAVEVEGDRVRLHQVLTNLIDNATKHGPSGTDVTVRYEARGSEVITYVTDDGPPIAEMERERIFDRFYQTGNEGGRAHRGLGLGLYISRAIVEAHGGRMWVEEAATSSFAFSLPRGHQESVA